MLRFHTQQAYCNTGVLLKRAVCHLSCVHVCCHCLETAFEGVCEAGYRMQTSSSRRSCMGNACVSGSKQPPPPPAPAPPCCKDVPPLGAYTRSASQAVGRVDVASPLNDPALHPANAYTPTERLLARLEALTLVPPVCQEQHAALYRHALPRPALTWACGGRAWVHL